MKPAFICVNPYISQCYNFVVTRRGKPFSLTTMLQALEDPTRLRLLNLISDQEICVCYFVEALQLDQPKISRHLAYLRKAGLVGTRKQGKWVYYKITFPSDPGAARILREILKWAAQEPDSKRDSARLAHACCYPNRLQTIERAPLPNAVGAHGARKVRAIHDSSRPKIGMRR